MARVRLTVKDISEGAGSGEEKDHVSEEKDLSNVDADPSELMKRDKPEPTLRFGPSLMAVALLESYVEKRYFPAGVCRPPQAEETPNPKMGNVLCSAIFLLLGSGFLLIRLFQRFWLGTRLRFIS